MSFRDYKELIDEGDTVILYLSNSLYAIDVRREIKNKKGEMVENVYQTPFGALKIKNLIGVHYGSRVELSKGWGHVLQPTPELWSLTLPHRTQIIYTPDISMIMFQLDLIPGSIVIEAGTGSGSLTHALIRRVRPHGHVFTFDFHEHRAKVAEEEFKSHGLDDFVTVAHRDVCNLGFGEELINKADAVFLDLPSPWSGVPHAVKALNVEGGRFCSFSPCIEQVQRTCLALTENGFEELSTIEVLQTELRVARRTVPVRDLAFLKNKLLPRELEILVTTMLFLSSILLSTGFFMCNAGEITHESSECPVQEKPGRETSYVSGAWPASAPGHTGYLTLATLPPRTLRLDAKNNNATSQETEVSPEDNKMVI